MVRGVLLANKVSHVIHFKCYEAGLRANWKALADTSHVPCKFFRQGACQAGKACPFSHDLASTTDNVCKYFAKVCYL